MPLLGTLLKRGIKIRESLEQEYSHPFELQKQELKKLLIQARNTDFGNAFGFNGILRSFRFLGPHDFYEAYKANIPIQNYETMYNKWWYKSLNGHKDVSWPGRIKHFALSSGTSEASSKALPVSKELSRSIQKTSMRQILTLSKYDLPSKFFETGILMLGGSTKLNDRGHYFEGDLSGIQAANLPFWFQQFYKPGKKIAQTREWDAKLNEICESAPDWDIGIIVGVPAWIQILIERILNHYQANNIHEIWPNLRVFVHGGVSFDPYRKSFTKLLGRPIHYIETYLASEGFIAFQANPDQHSMRMVLNNGMFYEFIPFNEDNIDIEGNIKPGATSLMIDQVEENVEYALLISTCAGAWRYAIGDVVKFTSIVDSEIIITGRTKHFLSLCGEHLSVDNMTKAVELVSDELGIAIKEFTVAGIPHDSLFAHHWFLGTDSKVDSAVIREKLDGHLMTLNDDYKTERGAALKEIIVETLPIDLFYKYMDQQGKSGGQNKFPRVLKGDQLSQWRSYLEEAVHV